MSNKLSIFNFQNTQNVRVQLLNNAPFFCLTDIVSILDIKNANSSRFKLSTDGIHKMYSADSLGRRNELTFINEPNLYRVIFRSNKTEAVEFQNWVFDEVLPQIRKTGSYHKTTRDERTPLRDAVNMLVGKKGLMYPEAYSFIHQRFAVAHIDELTKEQIPSAIEYIHKLVFEGELLPKKQSPVLIENTALTQNIKALTHHCRFVSDIYLKELDPILCQLRSDYAELLIDHFKAIYILSKMVNNSYNRMISPH